MNMGMILSYTASCGAAVNFSDEGYINSSEQELAFRRENMRSTAEQIAQETQLDISVRRIGTNALKLPEYCQSF